MMVVSRVPSQVYIRSQECPDPDSSAKLFLSVIWSLMVTGMPWRSSTSCWIMLLTSWTSENSPW